MSELASPLVFLNLASAAGRAELHEDPLVGALQLRHQADDPRLLIALGEISGSARPIIPRRMTRLDDLLIIWLGDREWLVVPHLRYLRNAEQALLQSFGEHISLEPVPDGCFHAELSGHAAMLLADCESVGLNGGGRLYINKHELRDLCIHPWTSAVDYHLILTQADKALLEEWLQVLQFPQKNRSPSLVLSSRGERHH